MLENFATIVGNGEYYPDESFAVIDAILDGAENPITLTFKGKHAKTVLPTLAFGDELLIKGIEKHNTVYITECEIVQTVADLVGRNVNLFA